jgi:hypothetical protein
MHTNLNANAGWHLVPVPTDTVTGWFYVKTGKQILDEIDRVVDSVQSIPDDPIPDIIIDSQ